MNSDPILAATLDDLGRLRSWCAAKNVTEIPPNAVNYIAENAEALAFFISAVYDVASEQDRAAYQAAHNELDYSVIRAGNRGLAEATLSGAIQQMSGNPLRRVTDDDVVVLHRVIQYAPYIQSAPCQIGLTLSPLQLK